jgi:hypothetical protein
MRLEIILLILIFFPFIHSHPSGDDYYVVPSSTVVTGLLDMREGSRHLHFLLDDVLLPHSIVNIPSDDRIHMGVCCVCDILFYFKLKL